MNDLMTQTNQPFFDPDLVFPNPEFPLLVDVKDDGNIQITWDENSPITSHFNTWTSDDFINMLTSAAQQVIDNESNKSEEEI